MEHAPLYGVEISFHCEGESMGSSNSWDLPFIYNLFPKLVGEVDKWIDHVKRAADMGFNWLFLNPIQLTGASGSLYSIRDYFTFSPLFFPQKDVRDQKAALRRFCEECRDLGVEVMVDLVINHTAYDNPLTRDRRNWYKTNPDGSIKNPGAADDRAPGGYVVWGDLSEIDNEHSPDRHNLWEYWWKVVDMFLEIGLRGFRCDAAYKVPVDLWRMLIQRAKNKASETKFFAESLGCPISDTLALAAAGHDYTFNSGKWWNYRDDWFLDQMRQCAGKTRSICFPESHDTLRLAEEWNNNIDRIKQHYIFTALISTGVLITIGFEYGFRKKPHVVHTNPFDWEGAHYDLTDFIRQINTLKRQHRVFQEDNRIERVESGNPNILALKKTTLDNKERALMLFNLQGGDEMVDIQRILQNTGSPRLRMEDGTEPSRLKLGGWGVALLALP